MLKNPDLWRPTKFVRTGDGFAASPDPARVGPSSRLIANLQAEIYPRLLADHARGTMLDLGCGFVPLYEAYKDRVDNVVCVDWENSVHKNPHLDLTVDLNGPIPLPSDAFDTVLMTDVLEHIAEPLRLMNEVTRLLNTGGKLIAAVPFLYWLHEEPHDYYRYTEHALRRFCELAGLRIHLLEPYGGLPEVMADLTAKSANYLPPKLASVAIRMHRAAAAPLIASGLSRKLSAASAPKFPLGYVWVAQKGSD